MKAIQIRIFLIQILNWVIIYLVFFSLLYFNTVNIYKFHKGILKFSIKFKNKKTIIVNNFVKKNQKPAQLKC